MTDPCPGKCNAGYRRAKASYEAAIADWQASEQRAKEWRACRNQGFEGPEPPRCDEPERFTRRGWPGEPIWCSECMATLRFCLSDLDRLAHLRLNMADGFQSSGEQLIGKVHGKKQSAASPSPGHDDVDELVRLLQAWEDKLRASQGWDTAAYDDANVPALMRVITWLGGQWPLMMRHPMLAKPFGEELSRLHSRFQSLTSTKPALTHKPLPCPGREPGTGKPCRRYSLFLQEDGKIHCSNHNCRKVLTEEEYAGLEEQAEQQVAS